MVQNSGRQYLKAKTRQRSTLHQKLAGLALLAVSYNSFDCLPVGILDNQRPADKAGLDDVLIEREDRHRASVFVFLFGHVTELLFTERRYLFGYGGDGIGYCHGCKGLRPARGRAGWLVSWRLLKSFVQQSRR